MMEAVVRRATRRGTRHNSLIANHRAVDWPRIHGCDHATIGAPKGQSCSTPTLGCPRVPRLQSGEYVDNVSNLFDSTYAVGRDPATGLVTIGSPRLVHGGVRVRF